MRRTVLAATLAGSLIGLLPWPVSPALAAPFTVNTTTDAVDADSPGPFDGVCATASGQCSLRAAIEEANALAGPDTITVPAGTYPLTTGPAGDDLARIGDLDVTDDLTIAGAGPGLTVLDGMALDRVLDVLGATSFTVTDLTLRGGMGPGGGGLRASSASDSTVQRVVITGNTSPGNPAGGASFGKVTMTDALITENTASGQGGGLLVQGFSVLTNVTATGNSTQHEGGGISAGGSGTEPVTLNAVTVTGNTADSDGNGLGSFGGVHSDFVVLTVENSLVAGNTDGSPGAEAPDCGGSGSMVSGGNNLIGNGTGCGFMAQGSDQVGSGGAPMDPKLGPLADNGGPTMTHALLAGSPAIDAGGPDCPATDQRGLPRPQGAGCDIGAYELTLCAGTPVNRFGTEGDEALVGTKGRTDCWPSGVTTASVASGATTRSVQAPGTTKPLGRAARTSSSGKEARTSSSAAGGGTA